MICPKCGEKLKEIALHYECNNCNVEYWQVNDEDIFSVKKLSDNEEEIKTLKEENKYLKYLLKISEEELFNLQSQWVEEEE